MKLLNKWKSTPVKKTLRQSTGVLRRKKSDCNDKNNRLGARTYLSGKWRQILTCEGGFNGGLLCLEGYDYVQTIYRRGCSSRTSSGEDLRRQNESPPPQMGLKSLRVEQNGRLLWTKWWIFKFPYHREVFNQTRSYEELNQGPATWRVVMICLYWLIQWIYVMFNTPTASWPKTLSSTKQKLN